jgi:very-short-patch-repair endonuclease
MWGRATLADLRSFTMDAAPPIKPKRKLARYMRRNPSFAERTLWKLLRHRRLERLKFRRQMPIGPYVVDFICLRHRLIVEADGPVHTLWADNPIRDEWLRGQGFRILRIPSADVFSSPQQVLARIVEAATSR